MTRRGWARGKLILFGEHCCVYGYPAVALPLDMSLTLEWRDKDSGKTSDDSGDEAGEKEWVELKTSGEGLLFHGLLADARGLPGVTGGLVPSGGAWFCHSLIPRAGGFGSSAALCAALARLILGNSGTGEYNRETHILANHMEKAFHCSPSGIDTGTALSNEVSVWTGRERTRKGLKERKEMAVLPERRIIDMPSLCLAYGALPRDKPTAETVRQIRKLYEQGDCVVRDTMAMLGKLTEDFIQGCLEWNKSWQARKTTKLLGREWLDNPFSSRVGKLMYRAQGLLASIGLSNRDMDILLDYAISMDATGGKLSGGGMGGAFVLCFRDADSRERLISSLSRYLETRGVRLAHPVKPLNLFCQGQS